MTLKTTFIPRFQQDLPLHTLEQHGSVKPLLANARWLKYAVTAKFPPNSCLCELIQRITLILISIITLPLFALVAAPGLISHACEKTHSPKNLNAELQQKLKGKKTIVLVRGLPDGLGDYMCARKIWYYLKEQLGQPTANIALATENEEMRKIFSGEGINVMNDDFESRSDFDPDFQIIASVTDEWYVRDKVNMEDLPTMAIVELAFERPAYLDKYRTTHAYALGLAPQSMGIILNPKLLAWSQQEHTTIEKLQQLQHVPAVLQRAILGFEYSQKIVKTFSESNKFYFCYAKHESELLSYIQAVARMNFCLKDDSHLTFYCMGIHLCWPTLWLNKEEVFESLRASGFKQIQFIYLENQTKNETVPISSRSGNTLKIVVGKVDPQYVEYLHMASEYETLMTGDQSVAEAISVRKLTAYETFDHKEDVQKQFYTALPADVRNQMQFYKDKDPSHFMNNRLKLEIVPEKLAQFYLFRRANANKALNAINTIIDRYEFGARFDQALTRLIKDVSPAKKIKPKKVELPEPHQITEDHLPLGVPVLLSERDANKLNASLPAFKGSKFTHVKSKTNYIFKRDLVNA